MELNFDRVVAVLGIILAIVLVVLDKAGKLKGPILFILLGFAALMTLPLALGNSWIKDTPWGMLKFSKGTLMICLVGIGYSLLAIWISEPSSENKSSEAPTTRLQEPLSKKPSLIFVFGVPLGENDSSTWLMMLRHYGPDPAHNCRIDFADDDRKSIEHQWLVKHPNHSFLPAGMFEPSQASVYVAEGGLEGAAGSFQWHPLDPDRQHYTVSVSCRDGVFEEKLEVTRVNGALRAKVEIKHGPQWVERNPDVDPIVFKCEDEAFVHTNLFTERPNKPPKKINPGWKPNHRFDIPVAIIDPNGNVQVLSGVKQPDGSTLNDFGSWNILTKHYGD